MFRFFNKLPNHFPEGSTILYARLPCLTDPGSPQPHQHLAGSLLFLLALLASEFPWVLMILNIFVMCLFAIHVISLVKRLLLSFAYFLIGWFPFLMLSFDRSLYSLNVGPSSEMWFANVFLTGCSLSCYFNGAFHGEKSLNFNEIKFLDLFSYALCFWHHV